MLAAVVGLGGGKLAAKAADVAALYEKGTPIAGGAAVISIPEELTARAQAAAGIVGMGKTLLGMTDPLVTSAAEALDALYDAEGPAEQYAANTQLAAAIDSLYQQLKPIADESDRGQTLQTQWSEFLSRQDILSQSSYNEEAQAVQQNAEFFSGGAAGWNLAGTRSGVICMNKSKVLGVVLAVGLVLVTVVLAFSVMSRSDQNEPFDYSRADLYPSDAWYVTDAAGVLSADTEAWLAALGNDLYHNVDECDLVVVTVDNTGFKSIEQFAADLFNDWQIGNASTNRGVLLLLVTDAEEYWCVQGAGLETRLPTSSISRILQQYMEPDFAAGDYDAGVRATAAALYDELAASFGVNRSASQVQATSGSVAAQPTTGGTAPVGRVSSPALTILGFAA